LIAFYAPYAGGWEFFKAEYERAARELVSKYVSEKGTHTGISERLMQMNYLAKIDITDLKNLEVANRYNITAYPTFKFIDNVQDHIPLREAYEPLSGHNYESIMKYVLRYSGTDRPTLGSYSCSQFKDAIGMYPELKVVYFGQPQEEAFKLIDHVFDNLTNWPLIN